MRLLYNFGIKLFILALKIASIRNYKAKRWVEGRKGLLKKIKKEQNPGEKVIWVHCASLGEFEQGLPLIEEIRRRFPEKKILLSFFSPSGYEIQKNYQGVDYIYYLPADTRRNARRFIKYCNPEIVFFIKYEYWYNYLSILKKKKIPTYFVSTIFRKDQLFFKKRGGWYGKMLKLVTHFFLQNQESADLLLSLKISNHTVTGDTRFDRVAHILENVKPVPLVEKFLDGQKAIIAGSSWKAEEALLMQYYRINPSHKLIIVPHEVNEENTRRICQLFDNNIVVYSKFNSTYSPNKKVMIVDQYGLLTSIYQYGFLALIGGGFGDGIHNVLEAATFGMPVIFGPNHQKFKEAIDMTELHCAFTVNNIEDFNPLLTHLLKNPALLVQLSQKASGYVKANVGATNKILDTVFDK